jgi:hypothetical protein
MVVLTFIVYALLSIRFHWPSGLDAALDLQTASRFLVVVGYQCASCASLLFLLSPRNALFGGEFLRGG